MVKVRLQYAVNQTAYVWIYESIQLWFILSCGGEG